MRMLILVVGFCAHLAFGAVTGLRVDGVTNTQAKIVYTAPTTAACTVQVSATEDFATVVDDVNATLFPGSDSDSRAGSVSSGRERIFVVGNRRFEEAADGERYSRALQAATLYWARPNCGGDTATISFVTASVPLGLTRSDLPYTINPNNATGKPWFPTRSLTDREFSFIDPLTGVLVKNLALPGDWDKGTITLGAFGSITASTNWTNPSNALASGSGTADYSGASCAGPTDCDWLVVSTGTGWQTDGYLVDYLNATITGSGTDATAANRQVYVCQWLDVGCDPLGPVKIVTLPTSSGAVMAGSTNAGDNFRYTWADGYSRTTWNTNGGLKIGIRKATNTGSISIDVVQYGTGASAYTRTGSGGNTERCQTLVDSNNDYFCTGFLNDAIPTVYKINGDTGISKYLGVLPNTSIPGYGAEGCSSEYQSWSTQTLGLLYCSKKDYIIKWQYTGNGANKAIRYASSASDWSVSYLPNSSQTTSALVSAFVTANSAHYPISFPGWVCDTKEVKSNDDVAVVCSAGTQNAVGWEAVLNSSGTVIAARYSSAHPSSRWCGIHSYEVMGHQPISLWNTKNLEENATGGGPYTTTLAAAITGTSRPTTITVASITPSSAYSPTTLYDFVAGDLLLIDGEILRITNVAGTTLTVEGVSGAATHSNGASVKAYCGTGLTSNNWASEIGSFFPAWDYVNDPYGEDTTGAYVWTNHYNGHMTSREEYSAVEAGFAVGTPGTYLYATTKNPSYSTAFQQSPQFAGVNPGTPGLTMESHPTFHNIDDTAPSRAYYLDNRPLIGGSSISRSTPGCDPTQPNYPAANGCAAARVAGTSNIYKYTRAGNSTSEVGLEQTTKIFPHYAVEGGNNHFANVSGPGSVITDTDYYKLCEVMLAGECVAGSSVGDVYVVIPNKTNFFYCSGGETFGGQTDICVFANSQQTARLEQSGAVLPQRDNQYTRILGGTAMGFVNRAVAATENTKALPNGKWAIGTTYIQRQDVVLVKLPPVVVDSRNRSTWIPWQVNVVPPAGTDNVVVEFGYDTNFYCSENRAEKCLAITATIPSGQHPYRFPVEGTGGVESGLSGVSCSSSCTVYLPLISGRIAYYRVRYRNSGGATLSTGLTTVVAVQ